MKIKYALIGCGSIGAFHMNAYSKLADRVEFVACCDLIEDRAKYFAEKYGLEIDEQEQLIAVAIDTMRMDDLCPFDSKQKILVV